MSPADRLPPPDRMVAFTDAAVAIALTLLVLPLVELVPEAARAGESGAGSIITGNLPAIGSFLLGFAVIARLWVSHHQLFGFATRLTPSLVSLNLVWILTITALPFFVELVSSYGTSAVVLRSFIGNLLVSSVVLTAMGVLMRRSGADGDGSGPPDGFVTSSIAATVNFLVAFLLAVVVPSLSYLALLALFLDPLTTRLVARLRR